MLKEEFCLFICLCFVCEISGWLDKNFILRRRFWWHLGVYSRLLDIFCEYDKSGACLCAKGIALWKYILDVCPNFNMVENFVFVVGIKMLNSRLVGLNILVGNSLGVTVSVIRKIFADEQLHIIASFRVC